MERIDLCTGCSGNAFSGVLSVLSVRSTRGGRCEALHDDGLLPDMDGVRWIDSLYVCHTDACGDGFYDQDGSIHTEQRAPVLSSAVSKESSFDRCNR